MALRADGRAPALFVLVSGPGGWHYRGMAGTLLSSSRAKAVRSKGRHPIPVVQIEPPTPFAEGPGPGREWWEKALSEKSFSGRKRGESQQNQGVGANSRTTHLGPFGEIIRATGSMAKANPFRFSAKYCDDETDMDYYGYRYYKASTGSWENRDPVGEPGFELLRGGRAVKLAGDANRYMFVKNDSIDNYDPLGLNPAAACAIGIALSPIEVPIGAIITGVAVVGGVAVITYAICKHFCNRPDICPLTGQMEQPPIGDPGSGLGDGGYQPGYKICIYTCPKKGVVRRYFPPGTTCQPSITQP